MKLSPWLQRLADECTDEDMAQLNKTLEEPVMTEPLVTDQQAEESIADLGKKIETLGRLLQDPDSTLDVLVAAAHDAGFRLVVEFIPLGSHEPANQPDEERD